MIVSGYGMAAGGAQSGVKYVEIDSYINLDDVSLIIGRTTLAAVAPLPGKLERVTSDYYCFFFVHSCIILGRYLSFRYSIN